MEDYVLRVWHSPEIQRVAAALDTMTSTRAFIYERRTLFFFAIPFLALKLDKRGAHRFVQESDRMRAEAGLQPPTQETRAKLDAAEDEEDVLEDHFPVRQMISEFVNFVENWLEEHAEDQDEIQGLNFLRQEAYEESIVAICKRHPEVRSDVTVLDGTKVLSPTAGPDRKRRDVGADFVTKRNRRDFCRVKFSASFGLVPLIFYSHLASPPLNELSYALTSFVPGMTAHIERLRGRIADAPSLAGLNGALVCGDGIFSNSRLIEMLIDHDLIGAFRKPNALIRELVGQRQVSARGATVTLDVADNGDHFCSCDRLVHADGCNAEPDCRCTEERALHKRDPMKPRLHARGHNGGVYFSCRNDMCPHREDSRHIEFFVGYRKPNVALTGEIIARPAAAYDLMGPLSRGDIRYHSLLFKASQTIEHYHSQLGAQLGVAIHDRHPDRRHFFGNFANQFWFTLADLIWNLRVGLNLDRAKRDGKESKRLGWQYLFAKAVGQWHSIWLKTDGKKLPDESTAQWKKRIEAERPRIGAYYLGDTLVT
jgi:hypothetical protein